MTNPDKPQFTILRSILHALGLPDSAVDDIIGRILDWLSDKDEEARKAVEFLYQVRDDFLSRAEQSFYLVLRTARLPLVRVPVQRSYAAAELATLLRQKAGAGPGPATAPVEGAGTQEGDAQPPAGSATTPPKCPKCGSTTVLRTARTGANQGRQFWGCSNYPRCRGILSLEGDGNAARH